jgi:hypothetical protein
MKKQAKGPKFRVGQIVYLKCWQGSGWGSPYARVEQYRLGADGSHWWSILYGVNLTEYPQRQLRALTVREAGPARGRKA